MAISERYEQPIVVFTDGAAKGNPGPGGWGAIIVTPDGHVRELGGGAAHTTNNQMELTAPIEALTHLQRTPGAVAIYTDSTYVIRGIREWIWAWRKRNWKTADGKLWFATVKGVAMVEPNTMRVATAPPVMIEGVFVDRRRLDRNAPEQTLAPGTRTLEDLYNGPLIRYPLPILDVPDDTSVPRRPPGSSSSGKKAPPYAYLSVVDGKPMRHATWAECERRVKGRSGARFKKAMTEADEATILREWGCRPEDL